MIVHLYRYSFSFDTPFQPSRSAELVGTNGGSTHTSLPVLPSIETVRIFAGLSPPPSSGGGVLMNFSKLRASFKLPKFMGQALEFKPFVESLDRYASIQGLDLVMSAGYPTSVMFDFQTNK